MKARPYRTTLTREDSDGFFRLLHDLDGAHLIALSNESPLPLLINKLFPIRIVKNGAWHVCPVGQALKYQDRIASLGLKKDVLGRISAAPAWPVAVLRHEFEWARFGCELGYRGYASDGRMGILLLKQSVSEPKEKLISYMAEIKLTNQNYDVRQIAQEALEELA